MSDIQVIENKISYIREHLNRAVRYQKYSLEELRKDTTLQSAVERELYVVAQAVVDLAEAMIAHQNLRKPTTMREAIEILGEAGILPMEFVSEFVKIVGFRNALAHDYEDLDLAVVYDVLKNKLVQVEKFLNLIAQRL